MVKSLESAGFKRGNKDSCLQSRCLVLTPLRMQVLDVLSQTPQEIKSVSSQLPPQDPGHYLDGQSIEPRRSPSCKSPWCRSLDHQGAATVVYVMRMEDSRLPKQVFCSELAIGKCKQGGQRKRYKDCLKRSLRACNIPIPGWESLAKDRVAWRQETQNGITTFEVKRLQDLDAKRSIREERAHNLSSGIACPVCGRTCANEFGLRSHLRRH